MLNNELNMQDFIKMINIERVLQKGDLLSFYVLEEFRVQQQDQFMGQSLQDFRTGFEIFCNKNHWFDGATLEIFAKNFVISFPIKPLLKSTYGKKQGDRTGIISFSLKNLNS